MPLHKHKCKDRICNRVWEHNDTTIESMEEYSIAHKCPDCGKAETERYFKDSSELEAYKQAVDAERSPKETDLLRRAKKLREQVNSGAIHPMLASLELFDLMLERSKL